MKIKLKESKQTSINERLERVRLWQLEWACQMLCKGLVMEMADKSVDESERMVSNDWIRTTLLDKCWNTLEYRRVRDILEGGDDLRKGIETGLRDIR